MIKLTVLHKLICNKEFFMKKQLLSLIVLVVVLCLTACTANQNQVSKPTSPKIWGTAFLRKRFLKLFWKILNFSIRKPSIILTFMEILLWLGHIGMIIWVTSCIRLLFCRQYQPIQQKSSFLPAKFQPPIGSSIRFLRSGCYHL